VRHIHQQARLSRLRGRDEQAALTFADRCNEIERSHREAVRFRLEDDPFKRIDTRSTLELAEEI
jgi:hypothetical protein